MKKHAQDAAYLLAQLMNNISDNIYFKDRESRLILVNAAYVKWMHGHSPDEFIGKTDFELFSEEHARAAFEDEQRIIQTGEPLIAKEEKETWEDGSTTWVSTTKMPLKDEEGTIIGTFGISRNITEHMLNEIKLKQYTKKLCRINEQMEEELRMAANLQQAFLPQSYPKFTDAAGRRLIEFCHLYKADTQIGGDFCSVHKLSETRAGVLICDVMGHGVRAALVTGVIRTMLDNLIHTVSNPGDLFSAMNNQLCPMLQAQDLFIFATATYLIIDLQTGIVTGASAGHSAPMQIYTNQQRAALVNQVPENSGPALAIIKNFKYPTFSISLQPGDSLLMYTDGIYEVANKTHEEFGTTNLLRAAQQNSQLPLKDLAAQLIQASRDYSATGKFDDDVCLIGFTLKEYSAPPK